MSARAMTSAPTRDAVRSTLREVRQVLPSHMLGGAGLIAVDLAAMVQARGARSRALVPARGAAVDALTARGIASTMFPLAQLFRGTVPQAIALSRMAGRLAGSPATVLHVHNPTIYGLISPVTRFSRARTLVQFHLDPSRDEVRWALRHPPSAVVTCSKYIATQVRSAIDGTPQSVPVVPIQNAIDLDRFVPGDRMAAKARTGMRGDAVTIVMLANLAAHKGQMTALRAIRRLLDRGVVVEGWFAGDERDPARPFTAQLHALVADLGIGPHVKWLGFRDDGPELLRAADFFFLPSSHEGLPLSALEAMASGTVVIGSTVPGIAEVVRDGVSGFLVDADNPDGYADVVQRLASKPDAYAAVRAAALAQVRAEHAWSTYADRMWQLYQDVADRHAHTRS
jgi:glycosyltransferase involved in cell wall biosynthesis